jgi:hypothetical protein
MKIVLPTLSRICNKYGDLFDGYDSKRHYVQYYGKASLILEKRREGELLLEVKARAKDRATLTKFLQFVEELNENLEEIMRGAEELSTP